jgi:hypothetical protein
MAAHDEQLAAAILEALEERGAPDALAVADLMRLEQNLSDSLRLVRRQIDAIVRRTQREELRDVA